MSLSNFGSGSGRVLVSGQTLTALTDPYQLCLEDMPMKVIWTSLSHCFSDFSLTFDKLKRALAIIITFFIVFSYMYLSKMNV